MKKDRKIFTLLTLTVLCALVLGLFPVSGEEKLYDSVVRLHVLANSDSDHDQQAKIDIKDSVLEYISTYTQKAQSAKEAASIIKNNLSHFACG